MENKIAVDFSGWVYVDARKLEYIDIYGNVVDVSTYDLEEIEQALNDHEIFLDVSEAILLGDAAFEQVGVEIPI